MNLGVVDRGIGGDLDLINLWRAYVKVKVTWTYVKVKVTRTYVKVKATYESSFLSTFKFT